MFSGSVFFSGEIFSKISKARATSLCASSASPSGARLAGEAQEAVDDPRRAVAVLAAVLAHARRIIGDAAGIGLGMLEEGLFQQQHAIRPLDGLQPAFERRERAVEIDGAGIGRPARRHGVGHFDRAAVVGKIERIMIAAPGGLQRRPQGLARLLAAFGEGLVALQPRQRNEAAQHVEEEEAHPDAGSRALAAEHVDAVVPIAGAQQRQAVRADVAQRVFDGAAGMFVDVAALARGPRRHDLRVLVRRHERRLEIGRDLVEHAGVAGLADIAREHVGQPQMRIARPGALRDAGRAVGRAMPPFQHVAFRELLAGVQHDLRPRKPGLEQDQRQHVLQLVAEADGAATLVGPDAAEQARRIDLIGQPGVDQPVEVGPVGGHAHFAEPRAPRRRASPRAPPPPSRPSPRRSRRAPARGFAAWPRTMATFISAPGASLDIRGESGDAAAVVALRKVAGAGVDQRGRSDIAARSVEETRANRLGLDVGQARRGESDPALEVIARVFEQQRSADGLVLELARALVRTFVEGDVEERRDAQAQSLRAAIAQPQQSHVAGEIGRDEHVVVHREIAARLGEMGEAGLVGHGVGRILALERREARRVGLLPVEVADIDDLAGQRHGHAVETKRRQAVVTRIAESRIDLAIVGNDDRGAEFVGHHMGPRARRAMGEMQRRSVGREGEGPAIGQRWRRLEGARLVQARPQRRFRERRQAETPHDQLRRPDRVIGAPDDELRFGVALSRQLDFEREARGGIEAPELALVVEFSRAEGLAARRTGERSLAQETRARILIADESAPAPGFTAKNEVSPRWARADRSRRLRARIALRPRTKIVSTCMRAKSMSRI